MKYAKSFSTAKIYLPYSGQGRGSMLAWIDQVQALELGDTPGLSDVELTEIKTDMALMKTWVEGLGS
jgi:hypothetical protein